MPDPAAPALAIRLMIVEDEFLIALTAEAELTAAGYEVVGKAASFARAVELARQTRPDLVLMDIRLGDGPDGIDAAILLRHELDIPSLLATGSIHDENRRRAEAAQPLGWLAKPYTPEDLLDAVAKALRNLPHIQTPRQNRCGC